MRFQTETLPGIPLSGEIWFKAGKWRQAFDRRVLIEGVMGASRTAAARQAR
jgi:hypothetical protein